MLQRLLKPEYLFQPRQLWRRLFTSAVHPPDARVCAVVPGGASISVSPQEDLGRAVLRLGVFDLVVTETLWRLTDPGDTAIDAGANIGYMTAVLAARVGEGGTVLSYEPHPKLFAELSANVSRIHSRHPKAKLLPRQAALSERAAILHLQSFSDHDVNRGTSHVVDAGSATTIEVQAIRLDDAVPAGAFVGVTKVDVEGHELSLFRGADSLLGSRRLRDIVFEEHRPYPSEVTSFLESKGMTIFRLARRTLGPNLLAADSTEPRSVWEATSFLATFDVDRVRDRIGRRGWRCLKSR